MENRTTFKVCEKPKEVVRLDTNKFKRTSDVLMYSEEKTEKYNTLENGFVGTIRSAYNYHHALVIKPDDVWMAIMVQFSAYMSSHAEELRDKFVSHNGKKELNVGMTGSLYTCDYGKWCQLIVDEIEKNIKDPSVRDWVMPDFSTTTNKERIVGAAILMGSMKQYFEYKCTLMCGLPEVTLLGTVEDWEKIEMKAKRLLEFDCKEKYMTDWYEMLKNVLANFTKSKRGDPDCTWWNRVCSTTSGGSGPSYLSGWITVFSVFNDRGKWIGGAKSVSLYTGYVCKSDEGWPVIDSNDVPSGCVSMDVTVDENGTEYKCTLTAGHGGYVAVDDFTIKPQTEVKLFIKNDKKKESFQTYIFE
jgi:hypothetical protein